jgi:AcrR family transcriptional regulator
MVKADDGRTRRAERVRTARREEVLRRAALVFSSKGYHATSVSDIIQAAGIARGTFYLYFESKRAIFDELLDRFVALLLGAVRPIATDSEAPPPLRQMHDNLGRLLDVLEGHRELTRLLLRTAVGLDDDFDRKLYEFYRMITERIERGLELGQGLGLLRPCAPAIAARCVLGSVKEVVMAYVVESAKAADREALIDEIVAYNFGGLFRPAGE